MLPAFVLSARDAYIGETAHNAGEPRRRVTGALWAVGGLAASALIAAAIALGDGTGQSDTAEIESSIEPELERQLQNQVPDATVSVERVDCVAAGDGGTCIADVSDDLGNSQTLPITYTVDASTGEIVWRTD